VRRGESAGDRAGVGSARTSSYSWARCSSYYSQRTKRSREQTLGGERRRRRGGMMGLGLQHELGDRETRVSELVELRADDARRRQSPRSASRGVGASGEVCVPFGENCPLPQPVLRTRPDQAENAHEQFGKVKEFLFLVCLPELPNKILSAMSPPHPFSTTSPFYDLR